MRNRIYYERLRIPTQSGERKVLTTQTFCMCLKPLLSLNKQIRDETLSVFLGNNVLELKGVPFWNRMTYAVPSWNLDEGNGSPEKSFIEYCERDGDLIRVEAPPIRLRPMFKRVKLILLAPSPGTWSMVLRRHIPEDAKIWELPDVDWLHFVRQSKVHGFTTFERLDVKVVNVHVVLPSGSYMYNRRERMAEFQSWTEREIKRIADAKEVGIEFCTKRDEKLHSLFRRADSAAQNVV